MRVLAALMLFLLTCAQLFGCPAPSPPAPPIPDASDAATPLLDAAGPMEATCQSWCAHASFLGCDAARATASGATCEQVCSNFDGPLQLNLACRTSALTCEAADQCENASLNGGALGPGHREAGAAVSILPPTCAAWCARASAMKCDAAKPTPKGGTCEAVCVNANAGPTKWDLKCRVAARSCAAADACDAKH